jgi:hypothetical protein
VYPAEKDGLGKRRKEKGIFQFTGAYKRAITTNTNICALLAERGEERENARGPGKREQF